MAEKVEHTCGAINKWTKGISKEARKDCPKCKEDRKVWAKKRWKPRVTAQSADPLVYEDCKGGARKRADITLDSYDRMRYIPYKENKDE